MFELPPAVLPPAVIDSLRTQVIWFSVADEDFHEIQRRTQPGQPLILTADEATTVAILLTGIEQIKEALRHPPQEAEFWLAQPPPSLGPSPAEDQQTPNGPSQEVVDAAIAYLRRSIDES